MVKFMVSCRYSWKKEPRQWKCQVRQRSWYLAHLCNSLYQFSTGHFLWLLLLNNYALIGGDILVMLLSGLILVKDPFQPVAMKVVAMVGFCRKWMRTLHQRSSKWGPTPRGSHQKLQLLRYLVGDCKPSAATWMKLVWVQQRTSALWSVWKRVSSRERIPTWTSYPRLQ